MPDTIPDMDAKLKEAFQARNAAKKELLDIMLHPNFLKYMDGIYTVMRKAQQEEMTDENRERFLTACLFAGVSTATSNDISSNAVAHLMHRFTGVMESVMNARAASVGSDVGFSMTAVEA